MTPPQALQSSTDNPLTAFVVRLAEGWADAVGGPSSLGMVRDDPEASGHCDQIENRAGGFLE